MFSLWKLFKMCELAEIMHQNGHPKFIEILSNVRTGKATDFDLNLLAKCKTNMIK